MKTLSTKHSERLYLLTGSVDGSLLLPISTKGVLTAMHSLFQSSLDFLGLPLPIFRRILPYVEPSFYSYFTKNSFQTKCQHSEDKSTETD